LYNTQGNSRREKGTDASDREGEHGTRGTDGSLMKEKKTCNLLISTSFEETQRDIMRLNKKNINYKKKKIGIKKGGKEKFTTRQVFSFK